jgi:hypothetical protein
VVELATDYVAPLLRVVRRMSLEDDIRLLASQMANLDQFMQAVRGTRLAAKAHKLQSIDDVEAAAWSYYVDVLLKLRPLEATVPRTYNAYSMLALAHWVSKLIRSAISGLELPRNIPDHPLLRDTARTLAEAGVRALPPILEHYGLTRVAEYARSPRLEVPAVELAVDLDVISLFAAARQELGDSRGVEHVCYRLDALAARAASTAATLDAREVKRMVVEALETCLLPRSRLVEAVEEGVLERIIAAVHGTPYHQHLSPKLAPGEAVYHAVRKYSRTKLPGSLAYDPTEPGHAAAVLELLTLDVEDVVALATIAFAGLGREVALDALSLPI